MASISSVAGLAALTIGAACAWMSGTAHAQDSAAALPDWSGVWAMEGSTVFDRATLQPPNGRSGEPGVREFPPYNDEWEAIYRRNIALVAEGRFPDPISACGIPHGFPRIMNVPDVYEFAVTRDAVYIIAENGPNILRIYTDGRSHPTKEELWPTYNGASVGHWEGDTLVFTTISLKGASGNDVIVDRTGLVLSDASRATTRMRKVDATTIEVADDDRGRQGAESAVARDQALPSAAGGHVGLGLRVRGEQSQSGRERRSHADARSRR